MSFAEQITGKLVTVVFGGGVPALVGTITHAYDEYLILESSTDENTVKTHYIPVTSIVYIRR